MSETVKKALTPHFLLSGIGLVLLALVWVAGWMLAPSGMYANNENSTKLILLTAMVLGAWNVMSCVVAAGFFHAASKNTGKDARSFRNASIRLLFLGILFVFPVPIMTAALGSELPGRILALVIIAISMATILFGRARIHMIGRRLMELEADDEHRPLAPFEDKPTVQSDA